VTLQRELTGEERHSLNKGDHHRVNLKAGLWVREFGMVTYQKDLNLLVSKDVNSPEYHLKRYKHQATVNPCEKDQTEIELLSFRETYSFSESVCPSPL